jgi:hypothetical protein
MNVGQLKKGEVYAYISEYGSNRDTIGCASSVESSRPVRVIERVVVPQVTMDKCGRNLVSNQTMFKVELFDIPPVHLYADDLDAAKEDNSIKVREVLVFAKDCLCPWDMEVERALMLYARKTVADRFKNYLEGLMFLAARANLAREEVLRGAGTISIQMESANGAFEHMISMADHEWLETVSTGNSYYSIRQLPLVGFRVGIHRDTMATGLTSNFRGYYRVSSSAGVHWGLNILLPTLPVFASSYNIQDPPKPQKSFGKALKKWEAAISKKQQEIANKARLETWENRVAIAESSVQSLAIFVAAALPPCSKKEAKKYAVKPFNWQDLWQTEWRNQQATLLQEAAADLGAEFEYKWFKEDKNV